MTRRTKSIELSSELFTRGVEDITAREDLSSRLKSGMPLRIKLGIDATGQDLHIGHAASLWKIRALQEAGHKAVIILGDFTTQIGDPTGRSAARPVLTLKEINRNISALKKQVESILLTDARVYELRKNSEWFGRMKMAEFLSLLSMVTHSRLIERDMFQERIRARKEIAMSEMLYPVLQGYDSVMIKSDVTVIGSDQLFNEHMGRFFQERFGEVPQAIVALTIVPGLGGGEKMSKSLGNYIGLNDSPKDKFGKAMRLLDALIIPYLEVYTDVPLAEIDAEKKSLAEGKNPKEIKLFFAEALVRRYHGERVAIQERARFEKMFSAGAARLKRPSRQAIGVDAIGGFADLPVTRIEYKEWNIIDLLRAHFGIKSNAEARRLIVQGAVEIDGTAITDAHAIVSVKKDIVVRVGKKQIVRVI